MDPDWVAEMVRPEDRMISHELFLYDDGTPKGDYSAAAKLTKISS